MCGCECECEWNRQGEVRDDNCELSLTPSAKGGNGGGNGEDDARERTCTGSGRRPSRTTTWPSRIALGIAIVAGSRPYCHIEAIGSLRSERPPRLPCSARHVRQSGRPRRDFRAADWIGLDWTGWYIEHGRPANLGRGTARAGQGGLAVPANASRCRAAAPTASECHRAQPRFRKWRDVVRRQIGARQLSTSARQFAKRPARPIHRSSHRSQSWPCRNSSTDSRDGSLVQHACTQRRSTRRSWGHGRLPPTNDSETALFAATRCLPPDPELPLLEPTSLLPAKPCLHYIYDRPLEASGADVRYAVSVRLVRGVLLNRMACVRFNRSCPVAPAADMSRLTLPPSPRCDV